MKKILVIVLPIFLALVSCTSKETNSDNEAVPNAKVPVTLTSISIEPVSENIELRATSLFQKKVPIKANATGYIDNENVNLGDEVELNQLLFTIKTKEAHAIENQPITKDTALNFSGIIKIKAQKTGIITTLDHLKGDYVQDGDQLGIISEHGSLVFILEVPFELHSYVKVNTDCDIVLSDDQTIKGKVTGILPSVDAVSQTQSFVVKSLSDLKLPENLNAKIRIIKSTKDKAVMLPKLAILTDETQTNFWVMKLINDSTTIKVPIKKGMETTDKVEIIEPQFNANDRIVLNGNYGLADTAKISILKNQ